MSRRVVAPAEKIADGLWSFRHRLPQGDSIALVILWILVLIGLVLLAALLLPALMGWNSFLADIPSV